MPRIIALFAILTTLLAGCSSLRFPGVYRIDIPQGNVVTEDMLSGLQPGMTPEQVRFVLGPPTLTDPFTPNTWYYLLQYQPGNGEMVEQQIVVHFDQGQYSHYDGQATSDLRERTSGHQDQELLRRAEDRRQEAAK
ncbi:MULTISPECIES: outer membrane protein assembly factor BamE [Alcanivorax]|uniref:outer membrane protein assembly factor BamE n=1 Tax=Alcanivorax TaxID=59753 RepID=UPI001061B751|nr:MULTISPECIES: outer membrane protein assembly factor BamE [Alcanivorax]